MVTSAASAAMQATPLRLTKMPMRRSTRTSSRVRFGFDSGIGAEAPSRITIAHRRAECRQAESSGGLRRAPVCGRRRAVGVRRPACPCRAVGPFSAGFARCRAALPRQGSYVTMIRCEGPVPFAAVLHRAIGAAGAQVPYKDKVGGSNPSSPTSETAGHRVVLPVAFFLFPGIRGPGCRKRPADGAALRPDLVYERIASGQSTSIPRRSRIAFACASRRWRVPFGMKNGGSP